MTVNFIFLFDYKNLILKLTLIFFLIFIDSVNIYSIMKNSNTKIKIKFMLNIF